MPAGMSRVQRGMVAEWLISASVTVGSLGEIEIFYPGTDDDHTDMVFGRKLAGPSLLIQAKGAFTLSKDGRAQMQATYYDRQVVERANFWYIVVRIEGFLITCAWLIPGAEFNRLARREPSKRGGTQLFFRASLTGDDKWAEFRVAPDQLGARLLEVTAAAPRWDPPAGLELAAEPAGRRNVWLRIGGG